MTHASPLEAWQLGGDPSASVIGIGGTSDDTAETINRRLSDSNCQWLGKVDGLHGARVDEVGEGGGEVLHQRSVDGPLVITIGEMLAKDQRPIENVSDPYTLTVTEEALVGEVEPNDLEVEANPLALTEELRGYLDTRGDVDLLRGTGEPGSYHIVVSADDLPLVWRLGDGKARTPGAATIELRKAELIRIERADRSGAGPLAGRDATWRGRWW